MRHLYFKRCRICRKLFNSERVSKNDNFSLSKKQFQNKLYCSVGCSSVLKKRNMIFRCNARICYFKPNHSKKDYVFDKKFLHRVSNITWGIDNKGYAISSDRTVRLHNLILGKKEGFVVDHVSGDISDNRLKNLRFLTGRENQLNSNKNDGVHKRNNKWAASIGDNSNKKGIFVGVFQTYEKAIEERKKAMDIYFPGIKMVK